MATIERREMSKRQREQNQHNGHAKPEDDPLVPIGEFARSLNLNPQIVNEWCMMGLLTYVQPIDGLRSLRRSKIDRLLAAMRDTGGRPATHDDDPFVTLADAARQAGVSRQTMSRWCRDPLLRQILKPIQGLGGMPRLRQSSVDLLLKSSDLKGGKA